MRPVAISVDYQKKGCGRKDTIMRVTRCLGLMLLVMTSVSGETLAAVTTSAGRPPVGAVRALAIALTHEDVVALHRGGWLEAHGQLLSTQAFPELFLSIGRTWTASNVKKDQFAVPEIRDRSLPSMSSDNPFQVLDPADLLTGGMVERPWRRAPLSYWIFVGREVGPAESVPAVAPINH
jgi:hypothetical protein